MTQETKLNPTNHPAGTRAIMQCWPRVARGEQTVREWSPSQARVRLSASAIGEGLWEDAEGWIVVEVLPSRAPLSCGESEASEDAHALRESLAQEIRGVLRARNCWAPERASDLIVAVARALDSAMMLAETIRKAPGSAPVADAEEGSAASIVEQCAKVCDDRAAYVQTIVDEIESGVRSQARFGHLDALRSQLSVLRTTARKIRLLAPPTPPPARPFPTEEECRRAFADVATVLPGSKGTGAGIAAVRSLCLAALPPSQEIERLRGWLTAMRESGKFRSDERGCYPSMALRGDPAPASLASLPAQTRRGGFVCGICGAHTDDLLEHVQAAHKFRAAQTTSETPAGAEDDEPPLAPINRCPCGCKYWPTESFDTEFRTRIVCTGCKLEARGLSREAARLAWSRAVRIAQSQPSPPGWTTSGTESEKPRFSSLGRSTFDGLDIVADPSVPADEIHAVHPDGRVDKMRLPAAAPEPERETPDAH